MIPDGSWTKTGFHHPQNPINSDLLRRWRIGIVVAQWNRDITEELERGCKSVLLERGLQEDQIGTYDVPGCFEIPVAASWLCSMDAPVDAVIALGCLIKGETPHFDLIAEAVNRGLMDLSLREGRPMVNGVLTVLDTEQARQRLGGEHGHKGQEAAYTALQMLELRSQTLQST
jgi:6,7-dimethyl-8-ribityllumazine synthase